jgi:hypothetical protein
MDQKPWNLPQNRNKLKALRKLEAKIKREGRCTQGQFLEICRLKEELGMKRTYVDYTRSFISRWF